MRVLIVANSVAEPIDAGPDARRHGPMADHQALADRLRAIQHVDVDAITPAALDSPFGSRKKKKSTRSAGRSTRLAFLSWMRSRSYDVVFTTSEDLAIPLALLLECGRSRPGHVTVGHRISAPKKRIFYKILRVKNQMDRLFVYSRYQHAYAIEECGFAERDAALVAYRVDDSFFRPLPEVAVRADQICSFGSEWRDYGTLLEAAAARPDLRIRMSAFSAWAGPAAAPAAARATLPPNVEVRRYDYLELRRLYAESFCSVVPLLDADFAAGTTAVLEAMAMGTPVILTRTVGNGGDPVVDGETGLLVAPGDTGGLLAAIDRLRADAQLRERLGRNGRRWVERHAIMERWVEPLTEAILAVARRGARGGA